MKIMEFQKKYLLWRMDFSEPLRIPDFRVLETVETGETYAINWNHELPTACTACTAHNQNHT